MPFLVFLISLIFLNFSAQADELKVAAAYFPVLPLGATDEAVPQLVPVAANHSLEDSHLGITRAIIVIHDGSRNANAALATISALAGSMNDQTMIMAPQFLIASDLEHTAPYLPDKGRGFASWSLAAWAQGDDSLSLPARKSISTFTVIDLFLMYLSDRDRFPDLKDIVVTGFGDGANFVERYAAFTTATETLAKENIALHFLSAGASSHLYLTATRPLGERKGLGEPDKTACPAYDSYPYGLHDLNSYGRQVGVNATKTNYILRPITYLYAASPDVFFDNSCSALAEGKNGMERFGNYHFYLHSLFGEGSDAHQTFTTIEGKTNEAGSLLGSACGMAVLFGDGLCATEEKRHP